jgi:hypothetical protein
MYKKIFAVALSLFMISAVPATSFAAYGNTLPSYVTGNCNDLIYIKRPESLSASTSDKTYIISAVGNSGTEICIYKQNAYTGERTLVKNTTTIGASGLYSAVVDLNDNSNIFYVYASNGGREQVVRIDINKIKKSTVDKLNRITVTIRDFF